MLSKLSHTYVDYVDNMTTIYMLLLMLCYPCGVIFLRVTCCNGHLYLCKTEKKLFSENLLGRRFFQTCFKTVTLRLFGFLFSSPDGLLYFVRERAKPGPNIALFAKPSQNVMRGWKS